MLKLIYVAVAVVFLSGFTTKPKKFPEINYTTNQGTTFSNADFAGKKTIVVLFHLGCPPAMDLLKDLESLPENENIQIVGILENSPNQIKAFNSKEENEFSSIRRSYQLNPVHIPLIGECDSRAVAKNKTTSGVQCRMLAKKIKTKVSPTLVYVNTDGSIKKIRKGYISSETPLEERLKYLLDF